MDVSLSSDGTSFSSPSAEVFGTEGRGKQAVPYMFVLLWDTHVIRASLNWLQLGPSKVAALDKKARLGNSLELSRGGADLLSAWSLVTGEQ